MKKSVLFVSAALMMCYFTSCGGGKKTDEAVADATAEAKTEAAVPEYKLLDLPTVDLSKFPKDADGWITMFDGKTLNGWRGYGRADAPARWSVNDGAIYMKGSGAGEAGAKDGGPDVFPAVCCCSLNSVGELQMQDFSSLEHPLFLLFYLQPSQHLCQLLLF